MPLNCGHISFRPRSHRAQKRLSLSLQLSSTFKACFVTTALRQYYPRLFIHYYFEHRVKVNLVSLDAVTHFVTHCLLCTDRHFIFKYSACHFHDTKRSAHFFILSVSYSFNVAFLYSLFFSLLSLSLFCCVFPLIAIFFPTGFFPATDPKKAIHFYI